MNKFIEFGDNIINVNSISRIFKAGGIFRDDYRIILKTTDGLFLEINMASMEIMNQVFIAIRNKLVATEYPIIPMLTPEELLQEKK